MQSPTASDIDEKEEVSDAEQAEYMSTYEGGGVVDGLSEYSNPMMVR